MSQTHQISDLMSGIIEDIAISRLKLPLYPVRSRLETIEDLADSISRNGLLQPIVARITGPQKFEIVAGSRRLAACKQLGWRKIPCHVVEIDEKEAFEVSLIENIQRNTLSVLDEAKAFRDYVMKFGWGGVSELANIISKSPAYVTKRIRLLDLPSDVVESISSSTITASAAEELFSIKDTEKQSDIARLAASEQLSSREIRNIVRDANRIEEIGFPSQKSQNEIRMEKTVRAIDRAIIALRLAMNRLGTIIENSEDEKIFKILMEHKNNLHDQIDRLMKEKKVIA